MDAFLSVTAQGKSIDLINIGISCFQTYTLSTFFVFKCLID